MTEVRAALIQALLNGLSIGSVYAIFALGYTLVFSILRVVNFAHGAVFTLGAYFTYTLTGAAFGGSGALGAARLPVALPLALAVVAGALLAGLIGMAIERLAFRPLRRRGADRLLTVVSSLGVAIVVVNLLRYLVGAEVYAYPSSLIGSLPASVNFGSDEGPIPVRTVQLLIFAVALVALALLTLALNRTLAGKALRAVAEDPATAGLLGINPDRYVLATFFVSGFLGGLAGALVAASFSIAGPYFGIAFGLKGLAVIVLAGLESIPGAVVGALVLAVGEALVPASASAYKDAVAFALLFAVLLVRPTGLLGRVRLEKV